MTSIDHHIEACLQGDANRFEEVVIACEPRVRGIIAAMVPDSGLVPDLTQEVFVIAYNRLSSYRSGTNFNAWIGTIARNVAQNERRRWYRRREVHRDYQAEAEYKLAESIDRFVENLPEETLAALQDCVDGLHGKTRALVDGFYNDQSSIKELSSILKMSAGAAKVALHRARQALGRCIQKKGRSDV